MCMPCECGYGSVPGTVCDRRTGQCKCVSGTTGRRCDRCSVNSSSAGRNGEDATSVSVSVLLDPHTLTCSVVKGRCASTMALGIQWPTTVRGVTSRHVSFHFMFAFYWWNLLTFFIFLIRVVKLPSSDWQGVGGVRLWYSMALAIVKDPDSRLLTIGVWVPWKLVIIYKFCFHINYLIEYSSSNFGRFFSTLYAFPRFLLYQGSHSVHTYKTFVLCILNRMNRFWLHNYGIEHIGAYTNEPYQHQLVPPPPSNHSPPTNSYWH